MDLTWGGHCCGVRRWNRISEVLESASKMVFNWWTKLMLDLGCEEEDLGDCRSFCGGELL